AKDLEQHCLAQQAHYQDLLDQEHTTQNQPHSYFASWQSWALNGVKYFFGSDNAALVEKYREAALKQQQLQKNLKTVLDEISLSAEQSNVTNGNATTPESAEEAKPEAHPAAQRRLLSTNDTVTVKKLVPTQIVEPGDAYDYTIDGAEIFEGNFSFLDLTTA